MDGESINKLLTDRLSVLNKQMSKNYFSTERQCFFQANRKELEAVIPADVLAHLFREKVNSYAHMMDIMKVLQILGAHDAEYSAIMQAAIDRITPLYNEERSKLY